MALPWHMRSNSGARLLAAGRAERTVVLSLAAHRDGAQLQEAVQVGLLGVGGRAGPHGGAVCSNAHNRL